MRVSLQNVVTTLRKLARSHNNFSRKAKRPSHRTYVRAASVAEACELLRRDGDDVKLIAGGQSLVPMMAMRLTRPRASSTSTRSPR